MVRAVRGATTVDSNNTDEIIVKTRELLKKVTDENNIADDDIISVFFTVTNDLNAAFPAVAARELGWTSIALMCTNEIDVPGSLEKCIRILLHFNTDKKNDQIKYVYLNGARSLRPDISQIIIAIDGPAGAGKSTIAKQISKNLGIIYLDTGAMYRAVALKAIKSDIVTTDAEKLAEIVKNLDIKIDYIGNEQRIFLDGEDISREIRTPEVSIGASNVAVVPAVRLKLVEIQRQIALTENVVMDGRDIGTFVLPDAKYKFYLIASLDERARRRYAEQLEEGIAGITIEEVRKDMEYRDENDSTRSFAPLSKAKDAVEVDTTSMTIQEVVEKILSYIK